MDCLSSRHQKTFQFYWQLGWVLVFLCFFLQSHYGQLIMALTINRGSVDFSTVNFLMEESVPISQCIFSINWFPYGLHLKFNLRPNCAPDQTWCIYRRVMTKAKVSVGNDSMKTWTPVVVLVAFGLLSLTRCKLEWHSTITHARCSRQGRSSTLE